MHIQALKIVSKTFYLFLFSIFIHSKILKITQKMKRYKFNTIKHNGELKRKQKYITSAQMCSALWQED